ncbi:MAG: hypothetical protein HOH43_22980 [Candidatus Latescibacteria bacterium]|nr:hypothetical protein [Candidatus Latescibacterota bacterium]
MSSVPAVSTLLQDERLKKICATHARSKVVQTVRSLLAEIRSSIREQTSAPKDISLQALVDVVCSRILEAAQDEASLPINASGVLFQTSYANAAANLPVQPSTIDQAVSKLAIDATPAETILSRITGAERTCLFRDYIAGLWLAVNSLCPGKEVIIARAQVGTWGNLRVLDLLEECQVQPVEVGATNKVHIEDYEIAIGGNTGAILYLRPQTYGFEGFSKEVGIAEIATLGRRLGIPVIYGAGLTTLSPIRSGILNLGPSIRDAISSGVSIAICRSEFTGGPPCGIVAGESHAMDAILNNTLASYLASKTDSQTHMVNALAGYDEGSGGLSNNAPGRAILTSETSILNRMERVLKACRESPEFAYEIRTTKSITHLTEARLPSESIPGYSLIISVKNTPAKGLARRLRDHVPSVLSGCEGSNVLIDMRTVEEWQIGTLTSVLKNTCV